MFIERHAEGNYKTKHAETARFYYTTIHIHVHLHTYTHRVIEKLSRNPHSREGGQHLQVHRGHTEPKPCMEAGRKARHQAEFQQSKR